MGLGSVRAWTESGFGQSQGLDRDEKSEVISKQKNVALYCADTSAILG